MNRKRIYFTIVLLTLLVLSSNETVIGQGKLSRVRDDVRKSEPSKPSRKKAPRKSGRENEKHKARKKSRGSGILLDILFAPRIVATNAAPRHQPVYQAVVEPAGHDPLIENERYDVSPSYFDWGLRLTAVGATDFDQITQGNFGLLLQVPKGIGLDTSVTLLRESGQGFRDNLYFGDVNFVFEPIYSEYFRFRIGVGVNWLGDSFGSDSGVNFTAGFDCRLTERTIATGEIDFGTIGQTDITHAQISLGRAISQRTEWTVGYDRLEIGGTDINSIFTGLRFRF